MSIGWASFTNSERPPQTQGKGKAAGWAVSVTPYGHRLVLRAMRAARRTTGTSDPGLSPHRPVGIRMAKAMPQRAQTRRVRDVGAAASRK